MTGIGDFLKGIAPTIAGLVGGPLAATGVTALEGVLGLTPSAGSTVTARTASIMAALAGATPEQLVAIKQADDGLKAKFLDAGIQLGAQDEQDRVSARSMQMSTKSIFVPLLSIIITLGFFGQLGLMCFHGIPPDSKTVLDTMIGALGTSWTGMVMFYFGSSSGHQETVRLLAAAGNTTSGNTT